MTLKLYDLAAAEEDRRFSPYCWRIRMALAHKDLEVETIPWRFTEKDAIGFSGQGRVPVLVDGENTVVDSWTIATYLEDAYPNRPSLFGGIGCQAPTRFVASWTDGALLPALARLILVEVHAHLHEKDKAYFRSTREKHFGATLEELCADREEKLVPFRQTVLAPARLLLRSQPFFGGTGPSYADYAVFSAFQWARTVSAFKLLEHEDPVAGWRERMLDLHGGLARDALGYPV